MDVLFYTVKFSDRRKSPLPWRSQLSPWQQTSDPLTLCVTSGGELIKKNTVKYKQETKEKENNGADWRVTLENVNLGRWAEVTAAVTAGGENESMGGIDLVNLRQWCETNCIMCSPKLGQTGREREVERGVRMMMNEGGRVKCQVTSLNARWIQSSEKRIAARARNPKNAEGSVKE